MSFHVITDSSIKVEQYEKLVATLLNLELRILTVDVYVDVHLNVYVDIDVEAEVA